MRWLSNLPIYQWFARSFAHQREWWLIGLLFAFVIAWVGASVAVFGVLDEKVTTQTETKTQTQTVTVTRETGPSATVVFWAGVGFAGLASFFLKSVWDVKTRREEELRTYRTASRERVLKNRDTFYVPFRNRLIGVAASAEACMKIGERYSLDSQQMLDGKLRLLFNLSRLMSLHVWSADHGIEYRFRTEEEEVAVVGAINRLIKDVTRIFEDDRLADRRFAAVFRRQDAVPVEIDVTAVILPNLELSYVEFEDLTLRSARGRSVVDDQRLDLWESAKSRLDQNAGRRICRRGSVAVRRMELALERLESEWRTKS